MRAPLIPPPGEDAQAAVLAAFESLRDDGRQIPEHERLQARQTLSLAACYWKHLHPRRVEQVAAGKLTRDTLSKEGQCIRRYDAWDLRQQPPHWPAGVAWRGLPIGFLSGGYLSRCLSHLAQSGLSAATVESTWEHVRTVLNQFVSLRLIEKRPAVDQPGDPEEDLLPTSYTLDELGAVYERLALYPELQAGWVVGAAVGPRTRDLFTLTWDENVLLEEEPPCIRYRAHKTGKRHWVPLAAVTVAHLVRLQKRLLVPSGVVFRGWGSPEAKDPERTHVARRRNWLLKGIMQACGIRTEGDFRKPWQVLRSTANSRLNNHRRGAGRLVTHGPDADVQGESYWDYAPFLIEAVRTLPQPAAFVAGVSVVSGQ